MHTTSVSLLERLRRPDESLAWERFVELYSPLLSSWARRIGLNDTDAADLVQEVLAILVRKLPAFAYDAHKSFRGWLKTVALNQWRAMQRRQTPKLVETAALEDRPAPDVEAFWESEYRAHLVRRALAVMQAEFRPATWKACWECTVAGRPAADVAAELGLSVGAVWAAKFRVLKRLRQELDGLLD